MKRSKRNVLVALMITLLSVNIMSGSAQTFVHPGLSHKKSDLDRMKYMVEAKIEPFYSSYQHMCGLATAQYNYTVQGDVSIWNFGVDRGWKDPWFDADARAAYYGALRWYIEEDERYAEKAIEAIMAWTGLTNHPGMSLKTAPIWLMIEAAEIIRHTYDGWTEADIKKFEDMLVYPGYSSTKAPSGNKTWYWNAYMFDEARAGNQELCGIRTVAAIGVFLDNKIIYDRAMRYVSNLPARTDDLPYARGPRISGPEQSRSAYNISYSVPSPDNTEQYPDWGYCGVLPYNIFPNGQNVESSRDQGHTSFSLGLLCTLGEIGWNQGYNFFGLLDSRILKGLEYTLRYCVSDSKSFPDQPAPWEATTFVELDELPEPGTPNASADFIQIVNRTGRDKGLNLNPDSRSGFTNINSWELPIAHYVGRGLKTEEDLKWTIRARNYTRELKGTYEQASTGQDYTGYGALVYYRPNGCMGDPISGFNDTLPVYDMNVVPCTIEAENYDYNPINAEGRIYHDADDLNAGGKYRLDQGIDIDTCSEGGYQLSNLEAGEWLTYTIAVRKAGYYKIKLRYAAANADGKVQFAFAGEDKTDEVAIPFGGENSTGLEAYADFSLPTNVLLQAGVQAMKVKISGAVNSFVINSISVETDQSSTHIEAEAYTEMNGVSIKTTSDTEGASHVESFNKGDWLTYDVFIPNTQNYNLLYRLASSVDGAYFIILDNDTIEQFAYGATGGFDVWESQISTASYPLLAGNHTLKILSDKSGSKLNWIDFVKDETMCDQTAILPYFSISNPGGIDLGTFQTDNMTVVPGYSAKLMPDPEIGGTWSWEGPNTFTSSERVLNFNDIQEASSGDYIVTYTNGCGTITKDTFKIKVSSSLVIEAEDFTAMSGVSTVATTDAGAGLKVESVDVDDYMDYEINVPYTGNYVLDYRVSGASAGAFIVSLGGEALETISFEASGGNDVWKTVSSSSSVKLNEGVQTLKITATSAAWNINWIQLNLQDLVLPCNLPFTYDELSFDVEADVWRSGLIDISCVESVNLFMNVSGLGLLNDADYLNVSYKVDGGEEVKILEETGMLSASKIVETAIKGNTIEIIIDGSVDAADKEYMVSDIKLTVPPVFNRIEAEDFFTMHGIQTENTSDVDGNENVGWVHNGDWLMYKDIDLTGANSYTVRYSSPAEGNWIEMRLDAEDGPLIGKMMLNKTGHFKTWRSQSANILPTDGIYDVYLMLKGGDGYLFNLNWFQYSSNVLDISNDASVSSTVYKVDEENKTIGMERATVLSMFKTNITAAVGATYEIFKDDGVTKATYVTEGYKVTVTALDGITKVVYTIEFVSDVDDIMNQVEAVYPNPAKNKLTIKTTTDGAKSYRVFDMFGKCIADGTFTSGRSEHELDIADWSKGIYILQLSNKDGQCNVKVVKD